VGNPERVLAGNSYVQETRATPIAVPKNITFIEVIANQKCSEFSKPAVDAAVDQLKEMFPHE
jgi:hypothetical protein